jgi:hypothetical protein
MEHMVGDDLVRTEGAGEDQETSAVFALLDSMELEQLAERWEDVQQTRTPVGWSPRNAVVRSRIERRLTDMVCGANGTGAVPTDLEATLRMDEKKPVDGKFTRFGEIGLFFATTKAIESGAPVDIEIKREDQRLRVRGEVIEGNSNKLSEPGVRIRLIAGNEADERRVHRLLGELLRHRR